EAILGAIYVDCGDLTVVEPAVLKWYAAYFDHIQPTAQLKAPKSRLLEYLQARKKPLTVDEVVDIQGDAPNQHLKVECQIAGSTTMQGEGASRRLAEQAVAADIFKLLEHKS